MSSRILLAPRTWVAATLAALGVTTALSFVRAQSVPANSVTFQPGNSIPIRGTPLNQRPIPFGYSLPGPVFFGGFPRPTQIMPSTPFIPKGFGQQPTPGFFFLGGGNGITGQNAQGTLGQQGGAQGQVQGGAQGQVQGGAQGGIAGTSGGNIGNVIGGIGGGAQGGIGGQQMAGGGLQVVGQNFQNPTGILGFPQVPNPPAYIGGFGGGLITGSGIAGINGLGGGILIGGGGVQGAAGIGGVGGIQGAGGGFGGGGIGGKGAGFAGANGS